MNYLIVGATAALLLAQTSAEKTALGSPKPILKYTKETVLKSARKLRSPLVKDTDCGRYCFFENENDSWCISTTPPMVRIGWDIFQTFAKTTDKIPVKSYRVSYEPFITV